MLSIPFYPNTKDNLHCSQACLKMILKYLFPNRNYSFSYLDKVTYHQKGKWTWDSALLIFLSSLGLEVIYIADFDFSKFAKFGEDYLKRIWDKKTFEIQKKYSNLSQERLLARQLIGNKKIKLIKKYPSLRDFKNLFKRGYLLLAAINPYALSKEDNYASHLVVILDITKKTIVFHDPGLPPIKNRRVFLKNFKRVLDGTLIGIRVSSVKD